MMSSGWLLPAHAEDTLIWLLRDLPRGVALVKDWDEWMKAVGTHKPALLVAISAGTDTVTKPADCNAGGMQSG